MSSHEALAFTIKHMDLNQAEKKQKTRQKLRSHLTMSQKFARSATPLTDNKNTIYGKITIQRSTYCHQSARDRFILFCPRELLAA